MANTITIITINIFLSQNNFKNCFNSNSLITIHSFTINFKIFLCHQFHIMFLFNCLSCLHFYFIQIKFILFNFLNNITIFLLCSANKSIVSMLDYISIAASHHSLSKFFLDTLLLIMSWVILPTEMVI